MIYMTWEIVVGIGTLFGFVVAGIKFIVPLTNAITLLTEQCKTLNDEMKELQEKNHDSHRRLWEKNEKQDAQLKNHEIRLSKLDGQPFEC